MPLLQTKRSTQVSLEGRNANGCLLNNTNSLGNSDEVAKVISFPKDYGRNLLSEDTDKRSGMSSSDYTRSTKGGISHIGLNGHEVSHSYNRGARPRSCMISFMIHL